MKKIVSSYNFDPAAKKVALISYPSIDLKGLLLITNVTDNVIIYNFADSLKGGTVSGNIVTLTYDTSSMNGGDSLQIFYDDGGEAVNLSALLEDLTDEIRKLRTIFELSSGNSL
jgi:hypothetical protein